MEGVDVRQGRGSSVEPSVSFTQECWCAWQPGCLCLFWLMVQTQLAAAVSWALESYVFHFGSLPKPYRVYGFSLLRATATLSLRCLARAP